MPLKEQIESVRNQFLADIESFPKAPPLIDQLRSKYLGRKGLVAQLLSKMGQVKPEDRPNIGKELNNFKIFIMGNYGSKGERVLQKKVGTANKALAFYEKQM